MRTDETLFSYNTNDLKDHSLPKLPKFLKTQKKLFFLDNEIFCYPLFMLMYRNCDYIERNFINDYKLRFSLKRIKNFLIHKIINKRYCYIVDDFFKLSNYIIQLMNKNLRYIEIINLLLLKHSSKILQYVLDYGYLKIIDYDYNYYFPI